MKTNIGLADRVIRMIAAIVLMDIVLDGNLPGMKSGPAWIAITYLELTGLLAWSPVYAIFHFHTYFNKKNFHS
jgi:hypothetical protein